MALRDTTAAPTIDKDGDVVLGRVSAAVEVPFDGETALLSLAATVTADSRWTTRRCFDARVTLRLGGAEHHAGQVTGFHVLKPSAAAPHRDAAAWVDQWLAGRARSFAPGDAELMYALRALYRRDGRAQAGLGGGGDAGLDHTDDMVFVQKIYLRQRDAHTGLRFAGKGLLKHVVPLFHRCLAATDLPGECRLGGAVTLFLEPGLLDDDDEAAMWDHLRPQTDRPSKAEENAFCERVAAALTDIYTRPSIGFTVRARDVAIAGERHTVLTRRFAAPTPTARGHGSTGSAASTPTASSTAGEDGAASPSRSSTKTLSSPTSPRKSEIIHRSSTSPLSASHKRKREPEEEEEQEEQEEQEEEEEEENDMEEQDNDMEEQDDDEEEEDYEADSEEEDSGDDDDYEDTRPAKRRK